MSFIKNLRIAYWATFKPKVFDEFVKLYIAKKEYLAKSKAHKRCKAEQSAYNIAKVRFHATLKG